MKILSTKTPYQCPIFKVEEREVLTADGAKQTHWIVVRQPNVSIIALTNNMEIVFIKEVRGKDDTTFFDLPAGKMNSYDPTDEELMQKAGEELLEETGFQAKHVELLDVSDPPSNWFERKYYTYLAWDLHFQGKQLEAGEQIETKLIQVNMIPALIESKKLSSSQDSDIILKAIEVFREKHLV